MSLIKHKFEEKGHVAWYPNYVFLFERKISNSLSLERGAFRGWTYWTMYEAHYNRITGAAKYKVVPNGGIILDFDNLPNHAPRRSAMFYYGEVPSRHSLHFMRLKSSPSSLCFNMLKKLLSK